MKECSQIPTCVFFQLAMVEMPTVAEMMKTRFRKGDFSSCARYMIFNTLGRGHAPLDLAPNDTNRAKKIIESTASRGKIE